MKKRNHFFKKLAGAGLLFGFALSGVGHLPAQQSVHLSAAQPTPTQKIAPTMGAPAGYKAHADLLKSLYPEAVMNPLSDHFDRSVPGGFPVALGQARAAGVPESLLAEVESTRAMFDVNFPALAATLPRLQAARATWQEKASIFPSLKDFEDYVALVGAAVAHEYTTPGSFAQTATRLRKRDIARAVMYDLYVVEGCSDQYAILHNTRLGDPIPLEAWLSYASPKSRVWANHGADVLGHPFDLQHAGTRPAVPLETYKAVADAVPDSFWSPYTIPGAVAKR